MFKRSGIYAGVVAALGSALTLTSPHVFGQAERVEITGSAIRRIDVESSLPVVVLKKEDIARSGATSVVDLLQRLPQVQGGTTESQSVGGNTYGFSGISIHDIGETRTLVLLNGHRLAQFGGQTLTGFAAGFDLNAVPISAIERVEVLTDGASALYGADAIAGVVNFITKRDSTEGDVTVGYSAPSGGAKELRFSATKGFGSLANDGFNINLTYAHDERTKLDGVDRSYAKTGNLVFEANGKTYRSQNYSASSIPGNVANASDDFNTLINPYLIATGSCAPGSFRVTDPANDFCGYDFVGQLEIYPERKRDSFMGSAAMMVKEHELRADLLMSKTRQTSRIAAVPGGLFIPAGSELHNTYIAPTGVTDDAIAFYRVADLGKRTSDDTAKFYDFALSAKGPVAGWNYEAVYTHSQSDVKGNISGYPGGLALDGLTSSGLLNPFVLPGEQTPEANAALAAINYNGYWDGGTSKLDSFNIRANRPLTKMAGGDLQVAVGLNYNIEKFQSKPSLFAQAKTTNPVTGELCEVGNPALPCDQRFGDAAAAVPYSADRKSWGTFAELNIPALKSLELNAAVRYDHFSDVESSTTAKGSFRWNPTSNVLVRGSLGTGFHAPSVPQINATPQTYGVTLNSYACSAEMAAIAADLGATCRPGPQQYDQVAAGNPDLKPEKSKQATLGFRLDPVSNLSLGADFWWVNIRDAHGQLDETAVFGDPNRFPDAWTAQTDIVTGATYLAWFNPNLNLGKEYRSGIDFDFQGRTKSEFGDVMSRLTATYMIRADYQLEQNGDYLSNLGNNEGRGITFRWQARWATSLTTGDWAHTLALNYKSGYNDALTTVEVLDDAGNVTGVEDIRLRAKDYLTFDWQTQWNFAKNFSLQLGILNIFDQEPPFTLLGNGGQQVGYDAAYYDARDRTFYANLSFKF